MTEARHPVAIAALKAVHTVIFAGELSAILWLVVSGLVGRRDRTVGIAALAVAVEAAVFLANDGVCPITPMTERMGAAHGSVSDIFLPDAVARTTPIWSTAYWRSPDCFTSASWPDPEANVSTGPRARKLKAKVSHERDPEPTGRHRHGPCRGRGPRWPPRPRSLRRCTRLGRSRRAAPTWRPCSWPCRSSPSACGRPGAARPLGGLAVVAGLLYLVYNYAIFAFSVAMNPLTAVHIAIFGLSLWSLLLAGRAAVEGLQGLVERLNRRARRRAPGRGRPRCSASCGSGRSAPRA